MSGEYDPHISIQSANTDGYVIVKSTAAPADSSDDQQSEADPQTAPAKGDPVDLASGFYVEQWVEVVVPGTIPITLTRSYVEGRGLEGALGNNRISPVDVFFVVDERNRLVLRDEEGRRIVFDRPFNFLASFNATHRHLALRAPWLKELELEDGKLLKRFQQGRDGVYRLVRAEDANGNSIDFERDRRGCLAAAVHSDGHAFVFVNDAAGRRTSVTLTLPGASMPIAAYDYDRRGNMIVADCTNGSTVVYAYDERDRLTSWEDRSGRTRTDLLRDDQGHVIRTRTTGTWNDDVFGYEDAFAYYRPGGGAVTECSAFDGGGRRTCETDAMGSNKSFTYVSGYLVRVADEDGQDEHRAWDQHGNPTLHVDADGRRHLWRWAGPRIPTVAIDAVGGVRKFAYDEKGNLASVVDPCGVEIKFDWTAAGRLSSIEDAIGTRHRYVYDKAHRLIRHIDASGASTSYVRDDPFGRVTKIVNPEGGEIALTYGAHGRQAFLQPISATYSNGARVDFGFDSEGQPCRVALQDGRSVTLDRGAFGVVTAATDPSGAQLRFEYDVRGLPTSVIDALGRAYRFERDAAGRVVTETDFDGYRTTFERDARGRTIRRVGADGSAVVSAYDHTGFLVRRSWRDSDSGAELTETFGYDGVGRLISAQNADARIVVVHDRAGRVIEAENDYSKIIFELDQRGRRTSRRTGQDVATFTYGLADRLDSFAMSHGRAKLEAWLRYDKSGREIERTAGAFRLHQTYDPFGRLLSQTFGRPGELLHRSYAWSANGELTGICDATWGNSTFEHDSCGRVVTARYGEGLPVVAPDPGSGLLGLPGERVEIERFVYDAAGDIVASDRAGPGDPVGRSMSAWRLSAGGRAERVRGCAGETITYTHDAGGRVVERAIVAGKERRTWSFRWNALDRMIGCTTPDGREWRYAYDALGRRISSACDGMVRRFLWDGDTLIGETGVEGDATASWLHCPASGHLMACRLGERFYHVVTDHLGTPRELYTTEGELAWAARHNLWFGRRYVRADALVSCRLAFPGQVADDETGLHYNRHRYYDPASAQYMTSDPSGLAGGMRVHGYVSNPLIMSDPVGLSPKALGSVGSSALGGGLANPPMGAALGFAGAWQGPMTPGQITAWGAPFGESSIATGGPTGGTGVGNVPGEEAASLEGITSIGES